MTLGIFIGLILEEDARIELEIADDTDNDYQYETFWLSDFRLGSQRSTKYSDWIVKHIYLFPIKERSAQITLQIKQIHDNY